MLCMHTRVLSIPTWGSKALKSWMQNRSYGPMLVCSRLLHGVKGLHLSCDTPVMLYHLSWAHYYWSRMRLRVVLLGQLDGLCISKLVATWWPYDYYMPFTHIQYYIHIINGFTNILELLITMETMTAFKQIIVVILLWYRNCHLPYRWPSHHFASWELRWRCASKHLRLWWNLCCMQ